MSLRETSWAFGLRGVSPLAKLVAIGLAEGGPDPAAGLVRVQIRWLIEWCGSDYDLVLDAVAELAAAGLQSRDAGDGHFVVRFPLDDPPRPSQRVEPDLFIYVFASGARSKIGISGDPKTRLFNLQGGSPDTVITLEFSMRGSAGVIRAAERRAHAALAGHALGREWFDVAVGVAIAAVKDALRESGGQE